MTSFTLDVFGRNVLVVGPENGWQAFYVGNDGKRRPATEIIIPPFLSESELEEYIADLCHEWATERHPEVKRLG
jgi:hypothetical protein